MRTMLLYCYALIALCSASVFAGQVGPIQKTEPQMVRLPTYDWWLEHFSFSMAPTGPLADPLSIDPRTTLKSALNPPARSEYEVVVITVKRNLRPNRLLLKQEGLTDNVLLVGDPTKALAIENLSPGWMPVGQNQKMVFRMADLGRDHKEVLKEQMRRMYAPLSKEGLVELNSASGFGLAILAKDPSTETRIFGWIGPSGTAAVRFAVEPTRFQTLPHSGSGTAIAVPEPKSVYLFLLGVGTVLMQRLRRR